MKVEHKGEVVIEHPNRAKASSKTTRVVVFALLLASMALMLLILIGGWSVLQGMIFVTVGWIAVYGLFAWYVVKWNRGVLPVIAALAILMLIFGLVAMPAWFDRDAPGFTETAISAGMLGTLAAVLVAVQALLIVFAMQGFQQAWNVEVEHWPEEEPDFVPLGV
jgi:prepilin signal peptidase PulO-like enzyme (type II secretory pathway)